MRTWKSFLGIALCTCMISACQNGDDAKGTITIGNNPLQFVEKNGSTQTLFPGTYGAVLSVTDKGSELEISANGAKYYILLPSPIKGQTGPFTVNPADFHQSFSAAGQVDLVNNVVDNSHNEQCIYTYESRYVCNNSAYTEMAKYNPPPHQGPPPGGYNPPPHQGPSPGPTPPPGGEHHGPSCGWQQVPVYGSEWVQESLGVTDKYISLGFQDGTGQVLASFTGNGRVSSQVLSRAPGPCQR